MSDVVPHCAERLKARMGWAAAWCATAAPLVIARLLVPNPRGFGTHVQLGWPPCGFLTFTGLPCPSCGLTTGFAHMARFQVVPAVHANVVGVALFLCALCALVACSVGFVRAWPVEATLKRLRVTRAAAIIGLTVVLSWLARLAAIT